MLKVIQTSILVLFVTLNLSAQSFIDSFESYKTGSYLAQSNSKWSTWGSKPGTSQDVIVVSDNAHSGKNSIYFENASTSGGPTDVVLPFNGPFSIGNFNLDLWMYVKKGKSAYFNLQNTNTLGAAWTLDANFDTLGNLSFKNTIDDTLLKTSYALGKWIKLSFKVDLNNSSWSFYMDNNLVSTFHNSYFQVASLDIYAVQNSGFYVDDISYSFDQGKNQNKDLTILSVSNLIDPVVGFSLEPKVVIRNIGKSKVSSFELTSKYNGGTDNHVFTQDLNPGDTMSYSITSNSLIASPINQNLNIDINKVDGNYGDDDSSNNIFNQSITSFVPVKGKKVVIEEATGTWCGFCPRGAVFLDLMTKKYGSFIQGIAVHNSDPMSNIWYDAGLRPWVGGFPTMVADRVLSTDPSVVEASIKSELKKSPNTFLKNGATYDASTGNLQVSIQTTILGNSGNGYRIACVIVEDDVRGTGTAYDQHNYYGNNAIGPMGGFEKLPSVVSAKKMVYKDVARIISPNFKGLNKAFPAKINSGDSFVHNFSFSIGDYKSENIKIVGLILNGSGAIDNASSTTIAEAVANGLLTGGTAVNGIQELSNNSKSKIEIYPNPANESINIAHLKGNTNYQIIDAQGKVLMTQTQNFESNPNINTNSLPNGLYFFKVLSNNQISTTTFMISR